MISKVEWINKADKVIKCNTTACNGLCETCEYDTEDSAIDLLKLAKEIFEWSLLCGDDGK